MDVLKEFFLAKKAFELKNYSEAIYYLRRVKRTEPAKMSVRELLARAYFNTGNFKKALREFTFILENRPDDDYAYFGAGLCYIKLGDRKRGAEMLKVAIALNPKNKVYHSYLIELEEQ